MAKILKIKEVLELPSISLLKVYLSRGYRFKHSYLFEYTLLKDTKYDYPYRCYYKGIDNCHMHEVNNNSWVVTKIPNRLSFKSIYHV